MAGERIFDYTILHSVERIALRQRGGFNRREACSPGCSWPLLRASP